MWKYSQPLNQVTVVTVAPPRELPVLLKALNDGERNKREKTAKKK
jgi:hypothetical protein